MKTPRFTLLVIPIIALVFVGCTAPEPEPKEQEASASASASVTKIEVKAPDGSALVPLEIDLPTGWEVNPDFGSLVYEPANRLDFFEAPSIEIVTGVEGEASADAIPGNIANHIQGLKDTLKKISTGEAELDAKGAQLEVVEESQGGGEWFLQVKVTYPEGVSDAMYPPRYYTYRYLHQAEEPFYVGIICKVPLQEAENFLGPVTDACKSVKRL